MYVCFIVCSANAVWDEGVFACRGWGVLFLCEALCSDQGVVFQL